MFTYISINFKWLSRGHIDGNKLQVNDDKTHRMNICTKTKTAKQGYQPYSLVKLRGIRYLS